MTRQFTIVFILILCGLVGYAQIKTTVTGLDAHQANTDQIKSWRKLNKEKLRSLKEERKQVLSGAEKLGEQMGADQYLSSYYKATEYRDNYLPLADSLRRFSRSTGNDSTARERAQDYAGEYEKYGQQLELNRQMRDSLAGSIEMMAKRHVKHPAYSNNLVSSYEEAMRSGENKVNGAANDAQNLKDQEEQRKALINRAKRFGASRFTGQTEKVEAAQQKLNKLKKKYNYVPNSNDLSTATKANSLKGEPLAKRLTIGGTLQIHAGNPVGVDFNPQIGYRIHKKWVAGIGGTYRSSFGVGERFISAEENEVYGGRVFSDYTFFKSFFVHGEYEMLHTNIPGPTTDVMEGKWSKGLLFGVGKQYRFINKVQGSVMVLYNFLHEEPGPYERPWVVRFGFHWMK